jgi:hypothetical protein
VRTATGKFGDRVPEEFLSQLHGFEQRLAAEKS